MGGATIQLVRPPYKTDSICPPINLMALAGAIEPYHPVGITDFVLPYIRDEMDLSPKGLQRAAARVLAEETPVLGFTAMCSSYAATLRIAQECKRQDPTRLILLGGPHASFVAAETLKAFSFIDAVVLGEGETSLLGLLNARRDGRTFDGVEGLVFRTPSNVIRSTGAGGVVDDLDALPLPAFHLIANPELYFEGHAERFIEIEVGRGCPFACNFCSTSLFFSRRYRVKSPGRVLEEMRWLRDHWRIASFGLIHDNLTSNKKKVRDLCDHLIAAGEDFKWHCSSRTDTIDRSLMERMHAAGCRSIFFGVESGSEDIQRSMGKRLKLKRVQETFEDLLSVGLDATASFIIGFPDETLEMLEETLETALGLRMLGLRDVQLHPLAALPGTRLLTEHEARLVFHPELLSFQDITSVIEITAAERAWVEEHRTIFSNFYGLPPLHYPLDLVHQIRGSYFYLIHFRPYTLQCIKRMAGLTHVEIARRLTSLLPRDFAAWTPAALLEALATLAAELTPARGYVEDVMRVEEVIDSLSFFSDGANGWIHYKGPAEAVPSDFGPGPRLRPGRAIALGHDVLASLGPLAAPAHCPPVARDVHVAVIFEEETSRMRVLRVDALTARIIDGVGRGEALASAVDEVARDLGGRAGGAGLDWRAELLGHLADENLLVPPSDSTGARPLNWAPVQAASFQRQA